jgi:RNA polymerase sigma-70 factor, ECF subfamily
MLSQTDVSPELQRMAETFPEALSDEELLLVLRSLPVASGRDQLFGELFRGCQPRVTSWCYRITRNQPSAVDLAQEICFKVHRHLAAFRGDAGLSTWLYTITRNHCLSSIRKIASDPVEINVAFDPLEARVMTLHYGYEMPLAVITQRLELTNPSGAKAYIVNARRKLSAVIRRRASELKQDLRPKVVAIKEPTAQKRRLKESDAAVCHKSAA